MLDLMRKKAGSWIIKFIVFAIAVVFVFMGVGNYRERNEGKIASVNGEPIFQKEYNRAYDDMIKQLEQNFGNKLNAEMIKMLNVRQQALDRIIDQKLLVNEARKLDFRVSDEELYKAIMQVEAFRSGTQFDSRQYERILSYYRMTPQDFELSQKEMMIINKLRTFIEGNVKVSDREALEWYNWRKTMIDIDFILFEPDEKKKFDISPKEIKDYFEKHKANYKTEPKAKARFLLFQPDAYEDKIKVADEDVNEYYDNNQEQFDKPKTVKARHILIKVEKDAKTEIVDKAKGRAMDILRKARAGEDFAELAQKYSEGPSNVKGGDLGEFDEKAMVKPFTEKAFAMKAGEIGEPVRTEFGWHIIKVEKVNTARTVPIEEAKKEIREKLSQERAKELAGDTAEMVFEASYEENDLAKIAGQYQLTLANTDYFTRSNPIQGVANQKELTELAFELPLMEISDIKEFEDGYYILQTMEKIPEEIPPLKTVENQVRVELEKSKREADTESKAKAFLESVKNEADLVAASTKAKLAIDSTGFFNRDGEIPKIGYETDIAVAAFQLSEKNRLASNPVKGKKGYYVIRFREKKGPGEDKFKEEKTALSHELLKYKKMKVFSAWLSKVREKSEIEIEEGFLN